MSLLVDLWRETSCHLELREAVRNLMPRLIQVLPLSMLLVRRLDLPRVCVETVACGTVAEAPASLRTRSEGRDEQLQALATWCQAGTMMN
ncbi:MAG TPA: hypothetical protein VHP11_06660, partial [Tepidisphaeraceae bacterium]|nr:hypothetical protein [Tepidisphaeraceae bacterium]